MVLLMAGIQPAVAAFQIPAIIATVGPTEPTTAYVDLWRERTQPPEFPDLKKALDEAGNVLNRYRSIRTNQLPVHTPNMTPGKEPARSFSIPSLPQPVCLVGTDEYSRHWIAHHRQRLLDLKAMCIVVEAPDRASLDGLVKTLGEIPWFAAPGTDIAKIHQLSHYPVLISREYIEQ